MAAAGTVVVAGAVNVATGMLTQHWAVAWWAASAVLVTVGAGLQAWLTVCDSPSRTPEHVSASGDGAVAAAGSIRNVSVRVTRRGTPRAPALNGTGGRVAASGDGAIAAGGDIEGTITEITGEGAAP